VTPTEYLRAFARFWLLIALCTVVGFFLPFLVTSGPTTTYDAATTVVITPTQAVPPSTSDQYEATLLAHQRMATYAALADTTSFADDVAAELPSRMTAAQVRDKVEVEALPGAVALRIHAEDGSHDGAQQLATQSAKTLARLVGQYEALKAQPLALLKARVAPGSADPTVTATTTGERRPWLTGAAGLLVGLAVAVTLARRDPRLRDPQSVTDLVGVPVLGVLPGERAGRDYEQGIDDVRTGIFFLRTDVDTCLTVALTSPEPVDSLAKLSSDVAAAIAHTGSRVLLVQVQMLYDARARQLADGTGDAPGLAAYLSGTHSLDSVVQVDESGGFDVVRPGAGLPEDADLLHSRAFDTLLTQATERYGFVLVAAPATSRGTAAAAVAARCSATVLVLGSRTRAGQLRESIRQLRRVDAKVRGLVLLG
jgi:succinoglycan biosynthesis transport protein ExoP